MAIGAEPRLLLLDEPTAGMTPAETRQTADIVRRLNRERRTAAIVVEHDMASCATSTGRCPSCIRGASSLRATSKPCAATPTLRASISAAGDDGAGPCGRRLSAGYAGTVVLWDVSFDVQAGEVVAMVGRNGMGKTTLMRTLMGFLRARGGSIFYRGGDITGQPTDRRARAGIGYVPQGRRSFRNLRWKKTCAWETASARKRGAAACSSIASTRCSPSSRSAGGRRAER